MTRTPDEAAAREPVKGCANSPNGRHQVDTSMESGPNNCFYCEKPMLSATAAAFERAAKECEAQALVFLSEEYATHQPQSSVGERIACRACADAIRSLVGEGVASVARLEGIDPPVEDCPHCHGEGEVEHPFLPGTYGDSDG